MNDNSAQPLFEVKRSEDEIFIPAIDEFIREVNRETKEVIVETPEGLLDL